MHSSKATIAVQKHWSDHFQEEFWGVTEVCVFVFSRSGVIEKFKALELENPEKMEVEETERNGARQGRSEHRRLYREVMVDPPGWTLWGSWTVILSFITWWRKTISSGFLFYHYHQLLPHFSFFLLISIFPFSPALFLLLFGQRSAVSSVFISSFHSLWSFPWWLHFPFPSWTCALTESWLQQLQPSNADCPGSLLVTHWEKRHKQTQIKLCRLLVCWVIRTTNTLSSHRHSERWLGFFPPTIQLGQLWFVSGFYAAVRTVTGIPADTDRPLLFLSL